LYLAFLCILIIKKYQPISEFALYSPLIVNISVTLVYSIVLYYSGSTAKPSVFELVVRFFYLYIAAQLLMETLNPTIQIIIVLPTVIMALRYSVLYTIITAFMTTFVIIVNSMVYRVFEMDYLIILTSFIWILGLLVNASMEVERQIQKDKQKMQEREKLAAIGQLAAGIAHEVRNPLTTIKGFVQLLLKYDVDKDTLVMSSYLSLMDKEIDRMNELLKDFLQFAKPIKPKLSVNNINSIIKDSSALIEAQCARSEISMNLLLDQEMPTIYCDYDQIKQVIINIVLNAVDAMQYCETKVIKITTKFDAENIYFQVEDTGIGMTEEQTRRIFDPFYTTKEHGTGLGLSVCYSIIENHQGKIKVGSFINKGTVFEIVLPRIR
jgi:signal transduction histidine kinase